MHETQSCFSEARKIVQSATRNVTLRVGFYGSNRWIYLICHPKTYQRNGLIAMLFIWRYCGSPSENRLHIRFRKVYKLKNERQSMIDVCCAASCTCPSPTQPTLLALCWRNEKNKMLSYRRETALQSALLAQKWKTGTGKQYFTETIGLSSTTVI